MIGVNIAVNTLHALDAYKLQYFIVQLYTTLDIPMYMLPVLI